MDSHIGPQSHSLIVGKLGHGLKQPENSVANPAELLCGVTASHKHVDIARVIVRLDEALKTVVRGTVPGVRSLFLRLLFL
jgi:hypothetical protein